MLSPDDRDRIDPTRSAPEIDVFVNSDEEIPALRAKCEYIAVHGIPMDKVNGDPT
ncbi:hypothetical protein AWENTII_002029 [Aspergillus wentii]